MKNIVFLAILSYIVFILGINFYDLQSGTIVRLQTKLDNFG